MAQCSHPYLVDTQPVPCGKCYQCKQRRVAGWAARLMNQDMHSHMSFFVTLTYAPEHLMFSTQKRPTLYPSHLTSYWKALRKKFKTKGIKYYVAGEYGSNRQRPHYHALVFINDPKISPMDAFRALENSWKYGDTFIGTVTGESIAYTLKYISKKPSVPQYKGDTRTREFQRVSKGLGINYLTEAAKRWHHADIKERAYIPLQGGNRAPLPRYYKDKLYTKDERELIGLHMQTTTESRDYHQLKSAQRLSERKLNA